MNEAVNKIKERALRARREFEYNRKNYPEILESDPYYLIGQLLSICELTYNEEEIMKFLNDEED